MKEFVLQTPRQVGNSALDPSPITVDRFELASASFNFEPSKSDKGEGSVSIMLVHRATDYKENIILKGAEAFALCQQVVPLIEQLVLNKLIADGKLPAGTLRDKPAAGPEEPKP